MTQAPLWQFESALPGVAWPAIPSQNGAWVLSVLHQLERTQWLAPEELLELQLRQLAVLLRHAFVTVPYYKSRWSGAYDPTAPLTYERFAQLPILTRRNVQESFTALQSSATPAAHGAPEERRTSGSTGEPARFLVTPLSGLYWSAFTLRDHLWHGRDLGKKLAVIRRETDSSANSNWGSATAGLVFTGHFVGNSIREDSSKQLEWLLQERPAYFLTYPSLVTELVRLSAIRGAKPQGLLEVRTFAESLGPDVRDLVRNAWGVPTTDMYSASEAGYIALQCPLHDQYHVQSEGVLVEILDGAGRPCRPGEVGRIVVTPMHNFAMPLIRYEIGDYAEVGETCSCGRGLPVLRRVLGRVRNMMTTANGVRYWPVFGTRALIGDLPVLQQQFVQTALDVIEARLVVSTPMSSVQEERLRARLLSQLPPDMQIRFVYRDALARSASGKFEDFYSEINGALP